MSFGVNQWSTVLKSSQNIVLNVNKPDRNKKHFNFVLCAALLIRTEYSAKVLLKLSKAGLTGSGCASKAGKPCGGPSACMEMSKLPKSTLFNESNSEVAKGSFDVFASHLFGLNLSTDEVLVTFASSKIPSCPTGFMTWKLDSNFKTRLIRSVSHCGWLGKSFNYNAKCGWKRNSIHISSMDISNAAECATYALTRIGHQKYMAIQNCMASVPGTELTFNSKNELPPSTLHEFGKLFAGFWNKNLVRPQIWILGRHETLKMRAPT